MGQGLSCSMACGILQDQGMNPGPLHGQVDSYLVYHQEGPQSSPDFNSVSHSCLNELLENEWQEVL